MIHLICSPPVQAFVPRCNATTPEQIAMVDAWELLHSHMNEPLKSAPRWDHALVRDVWAAADMRRARALRAKSAWQPVVTMLYTPAQTVTDDDGLQVETPGCIRALISDILSYHVQAEMKAPNLLILTGDHIPPSPEDLPPNTEIDDDAPKGPWRWSKNIKGCFDTTVPAKVLLMGDWYAVHCILQPASSHSGLPPPKRMKQQRLVTFLKGDPRELPDEEDSRPVPPPSDAINADADP